MKHLHGMARVALLIAAAALAAYSSAPKRPDPTPLTPAPGILQVKAAWSARVGPVPATFSTAVADSGAFVASSDGAVISIDAASGAVNWRAQVAGGIEAGVGSDGNFTAVVDRANALVSIGPKGQILWRYQLPTSVITAPAVTGGVIVVQGADQRLWAFNGATGEVLWTDEQRAPALLLQQAGGIVTMRGAVVLGDALGHITALQIANGVPIWDTPLTHPKGSTEVERVVGITGFPSVADRVVCARAYQAVVGCLELKGGVPRWTVPSDGATGVSQDGNIVVGSDADGTVQAWEVADGKPAWRNTQLRYRAVSTPLLVGATVAVGDYQGEVSFLSAKDGTLVGRVATDGTAIGSAPVAAGSIMVVVTQGGGIYGFQPE